MSDIVDELRKIAERPDAGYPATMLDAAARIEQLSEELEREKREAERAQDAYGVRFLNYLEETARLTDRIERLEAALRPLACTCKAKHQADCSRSEVDCPFWNARAALEDRT